MPWHTISLSSEVFFHPTVLLKMNITDFFCGLQWQDRPSTRGRWSILSFPWKHSWGIRGIWLSGWLADRCGAVWLLRGHSPPQRWSGTTITKLQLLQDNIKNRLGWQDKHAHRQSEAFKLMISSYSGMQSFNFTLSSVFTPLLPSQACKTQKLHQTGVKR